MLYRDGLSHAIHAVAHFDRSIEFARHSSDAALETRARIELGRSWTRLGDFAGAGSVLDEAEAQAAEATLSVRWLIAQAEMLRDSGSPGAAHAAERALARVGDLEQPDLEWDAHLARAAAQQANGEWQAALEPLERMQKLEHSGGVHAYCAIWSSALLARSHLHTRQIEAALVTSTRAAQALHGHGSSGVPVPQAILWTHFAVLSAAHDPSAAHFLRQAREAMLAQANTIGDGALRARFLREVPVNRCVGEDWTRQHI